MGLDPSTFAPQGEPSVPLGEFVGAYDEAIRRADQQVADARARVQAARAQFANIPPGIVNDDERKAAEAEIAKAEAVAEAAVKESVDAGTRKAQAIERYSQRANISPELRDRYAAMADVERANAQQKQAENFEFLNAIPDKRAQLHATTLESQANAAVAQAKADVAGATTDIEKQAAQTRLQQAQAQLQSTQLSNAQAGLQNTITAAQASVAPQVAQAGATKATAEATTAQAQAGVAPQVAQATLTAAQAAASKASLEVQALQRQYDSTTDEQAKQAVALQLQQKQTELATAQQQLLSAQQLLPLSVATAQQGLDKGTLGALYGLQDKAKMIADMIRSGQITDPQQGMQQLQGYIQSTIAGTTPYEAQKTALDAETQRRQQDYGLAQSQSSALTGLGGSLFGSMASINKDAPAGSDALARSYGGAMGAFAQYLQGMIPNSPMNTPLMQSIAGMGGVQTAPSTTIAPDGTVTIQHTPAPAAAPVGPSAAALTAPAVAATPAALQFGDGPGMPSHVDALWANDPNLNPGALAATGSVDRTSQGLGGM